MSLALRITQQMLCPICQQPIVAEQVHKGLLEGALFGWNDFGICPCCVQIVETNLHDFDYQHRCLRYVADHRP